MREEWTNFAGGKWESDIDVRDFIQKNYTPYDGDQSFLEGPTEATDKLWGELKELQKEERAKGGVLDMETEVVSGITAYGAAYLDKDLEKVVGLQTDKPLKRAFMPYRCIRKAYGNQPVGCFFYAHGRTAPEQQISGGNCAPGADHCGNVYTGKVFLPVSLSHGSGFCINANPSGCTVSEKP